MNRKHLYLYSAVALFSGDVFSGDMGAIPVVDKRLYLRADLGWNWFNNPSVAIASATTFAPIAALSSTISNEASYNAGIGYKIFPKIRGDVTFTYRPSINLTVTDNLPEVGEASIRNYALMGNVYFDLDYFNIPLVPYVMGGLGVSSFYAQQDMQWSGARQQEYGQFSQNVAWQVGGGLSYAINPSFLLDLSYQYAELGSYRFSGHYSGPQTVGAPTSIGQLLSNQLMLGLRYNV